LKTIFSKTGRSLKKAFIHSFKGICVNIKEEENPGNKNGIYNL
jgi:hypothetical protein